MAGLPILWPNFCTGVVAYCTKDQIDGSLSGSLRAGSLAADAASDSSDAAYANAADAASAAADAASGLSNSASDAAYATVFAESFANADIWENTRCDCESYAHGKDLSHEPLWRNQENPLADYAVHLMDRMTKIDKKWQFWIRWYEAALIGEPLNCKMLKRIALIPAKDWEQRSAHVNKLIAEIEEDFLLAATPIAEKVELNPETNRLRIVPERMSQKALYSNILEKIRDGMADLRDSPQFDNALSALGPVFEKLLDRTFDKYLSSPQRVHDDFVKAKRRIEKLLEVGEVAPNDEVIELVEDLDSGAAHIRANMPQVRESMAALAALRIAEASDADVEGIRAGAEAIAGLSEPEMAAEMREDAAEIVASRNVPLGAPKVLAPEETYRLAPRMVQGKRILTKENLVKVVGGVRAGFGDAQIVMAIPHAVEILLRLLRL